MVEKEFRLNTLCLRPGFLDLQSLEPVGKSINHEYTLLINLINYFDTAAKIAQENKGYEKTLIELMGGTLEYYYSVYKKWIKYRRDKYNDNTYYEALESIVEKYGYYKSYKSEKYACKKPLKWIKYWWNTN